jgi:hypothetical protein
MRDRELFDNCLTHLPFYDTLQCLLVKNGILSAFVINAHDECRKSRDLTHDLRKIKSIFGFHTQMINDSVIVTCNSSLEVDPFIADQKYYCDRSNYPTLEKIYAGHLVIDVENKGKFALVKSIILENNVKKFVILCETIETYLRSLDLHQVCEHKFTFLYSMSDEIGKYVLYSLNYLAYGDLSSLKSNILDILDSFGYYIVVVLENENKLNILDGKIVLPLLDLLRTEISSPFEGHQKNNIWQKIQHISNKLNVSITSDEITEVYWRYRL